MQSLYYHTFIRSLSFAFSFITMSTLQSYSLTTSLGSSSIPCSQHSNCLANQVPGVCTHAFYRKRGCKSRFKKLWLQFNMRLLVGMCEWCFQVKGFTTGHMNLLTVQHKNGQLPGHQPLAGVRIGSSPSNQRKLMTENISEWAVFVLSCSQRKSVFTQEVWALRIPWGGLYDLACYFSWIKRSLICSMFSEAKLSERLFCKDLKKNKNKNSRQTMHLLCGNRR